MNVCAARKLLDFLGRILFDLEMYSKPCEAYVHFIMIRESGRIGRNELWLDLSIKSSPYNADFHLIAGAWLPRA